MRAAETLTQRADDTAGRALCQGAAFLLYRSSDNLARSKAPGKDRTWWGLPGCSAAAGYKCGRAPPQSLLQWLPSCSSCSAPSCSWLTVSGWGGEPCPASPLGTAQRLLSLGCLELLGSGSSQFLWLLDAKRIWSVLPALMISPPWKCLGLTCLWGGQTLEEKKLFRGLLCH